MAKREAGETSHWGVAEMMDLARRHAHLETVGKLGELMETLVAEPEYEFHPLGLAMRGGDLCRRYYAQFYEDFVSQVVGHRMISETISADAVSQEYDISLRVDGVVETHRVVGVLFAEGDRLGGERIYASERMIRLMAGKVYDEFELL